jgi:uncharacterized protein YbjQ (UPF0145 family)
MNKTICGLLLILVLGSCGSLPQPESRIGVIDYTPLIKACIFVTESNSVNFDYTAVGSIIATEKGGWVNGRPKRPTTEDALKNIIKELERMGANGIINLNIIPSVEMSDDLMSKVFVSVITVKGMAIKIPDSKVKKVPTEDSHLLGQIDGIQCRIAKKYNNGMTICTSKELTPDQIKKAKDTFSLKGKIMFNLEGAEGKGESYAGIDDGFIIIYKNNEFIKL